ncbi:hypothetical protein LOD99_10738 [Oopsacas minuta]|uniref:Uncharacterized protein n=1 Tax=Oopsacas minuta TaxID=111878 RepID=A0AAV7K518_9METZ|nr:hypothetical protein LOD99_1927 [Oopsacas minuta]KAI6655809.1 hypothetical protein LOD99_1950 [Oopsacas minuta]KAI6659490.1 hypothetical protein LOD99_10738 [Oopsacas minuta]
MNDVTADGVVIFEDFRRLFSSHFGVLPLPVFYETFNSTNVCHLSIRVELSDIQHSPYTQFDTVKVYLGLFSMADLSDYTNWELCIGSFVSQTYTGGISLIVFEASPESNPSLYTVSTDLFLPISITTQVFIYLHSSRSLPPISSLFSIQDHSSYSEPIFTDGITLLTPDGDLLSLPSKLHCLHTISDECSSDPTVLPIGRILLIVGTPSLAFIIIILIIVFTILFIVCLVYKKKNVAKVKIQNIEDAEKETFRESVDSEHQLYRGLTYYPDPSEAHTLSRSPSPFKNTTYENPIGISGHFLSDPDDTASGEYIGGSPNISHKVSSTSGVSSDSGISTWYTQKGLINSKIPGLPSMRKIPSISISISMDISKT